VIVILAALPGMVVLLLTGKLQKPGKLSKVPAILGPQIGNAGLDISRHFTVHLFRPWMPSSARGKGGGPRRFTAIVLNV